ncbi:MAG: Unknown protein [uncultured Sulfurovum sp.]|uniref:Uncharacterized protein n=1 Tax=uncultured Sulfurovum sp. TaxID=269237 RepID=A0A6S6SXI0_9BACT|nr:MAG: Unknown protein [uncultured Sulfurovum sp.]
MITLADMVAKAQKDCVDLKDVVFESIVVCDDCGVILFEYDEAYEDIHGKALCTSCSVFCDDCEMYFKKSDGDAENTICYKCQEHTHE